MRAATADALDNNNFRFINRGIGAGLIVCEMHSDHLRGIYGRAVCIANPFGSLVKSV